MITSTEVGEPNQEDLFVFFCKTLDFCAFYDGTLSTIMEKSNKPTSSKASRNTDAGKDTAPRPKPFVNSKLAAPKLKVTGPESKDPQQEQNRGPCPFEIAEENPLPLDMKLTPERWPEFFPPSSSKGGNKKR